MIDKAALRKLADEATKGEWTRSRDINEQQVIYAGDEWIALLPHQCVTSIQEQRERDAEFICAARTAIPDLLDQLDATEAECEQLRARLHGAEAANAAAAATLVDHVELNGHLEVAEHCHDYLAAEVCRDGDPTGKLRDFVASLYVVIDQFDRQRRSRNWYEVAYTAGKQKLIEHALSKVCCKGEPHTYEQEAIAAAEGRTDRTLEHLAAVTAARDEIAGLARFMWTYNGQVPQAVMNDIERLAAVGTSPTPPRVDDESRCAVCQWPLAETAEKGCVRGNCSMRPLPANYYAPERAAREQADMIRGVPVEQRGKEQG